MCVKCGVRPAKKNYLVCEECLNEYDIDPWGNMRKVVEE